MSLHAEASVPIIGVADLWRSLDPHAWKRALDRYWYFVLSRNLALELAMDALDLGRLRRLNAAAWYAFLKDEYFRWKYTAANRYATTTRQLISFAKTNQDALHRIKERLLALDQEDIARALATAREIPGLGTAGASGLLALMYPKAFATVDQFVVKALRQVNDLPEAAALARMNPEGLTDNDGVLLIAILRRKAQENNEAFGSDAWTPRKIDKILWTYGR
jgi:hypothetical protein